MDLSEYTTTISFAIVIPLLTLALFWETSSVLVGIAGLLVFTWGSNLWF